jgi:hypothetical protein
MPYIIIEDFRAGLDRRKMAVSAAQGSLQTLSNAHVTRGGEIEKRLALVPIYARPAGLTFGFAGAGGVRYVFGSTLSPAVPFGVTYQQLVHPTAEAMTGVVQAEFFDGKTFVQATYADGSTHYFYDGTIIADFEAASGAVVEGAVASAILTHRDKVLAAHSSVLSFSSIDAPTLWDSGTGFGFKNMSNQSAGSEELTALGRYQNLVAVFARRNIQIWYLDPDPLENVQRQVLANIGTFAAKSVVSFGDVDVFFLSDSGVRSLRARDSSNQSGVSDVGTPIDEFLQAHLATLTAAQKAAATAVLEPISGRYILSIADRAFVFSYFASAKTSAWSTYDFDIDDAITDWVVDDGRVWARAGDTLYSLGGADGVTYDSCLVEIDTPYIDGRQIATFKDFTAIDVICEGEWAVYVSTDPENPEEETKIATVTGTTLNLDGLGLVGHSPVLKFRLTCESPGAARLSKIVLHYSPAEAS